MNSFLFFQEGSRNNFNLHSFAKATEHYTKLLKRGGIKKIAWISFAILFGIVFLLSQNFLAQADEQNLPELQLTKSIEPATVLPGGITRVTLGLKGTGEPYEQRSPVDIMHTIDTSGSMDWYGDLLGQTNGVLQNNWAKIYEIDISNLTETFDVLLETKELDHKQDLKIKSPSGKWHTRSKSSPGAKYIKIKSSKVEIGTWEFWAEGEQGREFVLTIAQPPIRIDAAKDAAKYFIDIMQKNDQIGVASFDNIGRLRQELTPLDGDINRNSIKDEIGKLDAGGATAIGKGIEKATDELNSGRGRTHLTQAIILLTDGVETRCTDLDDKCHPLNQAQSAADEGVIIYTIGFGGADENLLQQIADLTDGKYYKANSVNDLELIYNQISQEFSDVVASGTVITDILPDYIEYAGNATIDPDEIINNPDGTTTLIWNLNKIKIGDEFSVSFDIKVHKENGKHLVDEPNSRVDFYNYLGDEDSKEFPETFVNVASEGEEPGPSPTPSPGGSSGSSYTPPKKYSDLSISKTDGQETADPDQILEYSITCVNIGDAEAKDVEVIDILPDFVKFISASNDGIYDQEKNQVVWNLGNILAGISKVLNLEVKVFSEIPAEGTVLTNKVEIKTTSDDSDLSNNQAEDITNVGAVKGVEGKVEAEEILPKAGTEFSIILLMTMIVMGLVVEIKEQLLKN